MKARTVLKFGFFFLELIGLFLQITAMIHGDEKNVYFWWGFVLFAILMHNWLVDEFFQGEG